MRSALFRGSHIQNGEPFWIANTPPSEPADGVGRFENTARLAPLLTPPPPVFSCGVTAPNTPRSERAAACPPTGRNFIVNASRCSIPHEKWVRARAACECKPSEPATIGSRRKKRESTERFPRGVEAFFSIPPEVDDSQLREMGVWGNEFPHRILRTPRTPRTPFVSRTPVPLALFSPKGLQSGAECAIIS